ncbi:MAG: DUF3426 domain-containing protein [Kangiellaceae bacterium]|nr:DUF3426 domain-containing protein [Kangiellaceae bacterium]
MSETFLTNCPHCKSVFKLRKEHLEVASGHVRCGNCRSLFLATDSLVSLEKETQKAQMEDTVDKAEEKLFEKLIPELTDQDKSEHYELDGSAQAESSTTNLLKWVAYAIPVIALSFLAFWYLYLWPNKSALAQDASWRPVLQFSCSILQCQVPPLQDLEQYRVSAIDVSDSSGGQKKVTMVLKNNANFAQPFPKMRVILSDIKGNQFATPIYTPEQYLPELNHNALIQPNQSVQIAFSFNSDQRTYSGYQVELVN